ncbi:hypothetical protein ACFWDA_23290 [Rhodococcus zopfii]|uniref:hypothetical protein n=1 Tax=Rhodococcus zopfii TaxID=43772 RepID=UPI00366345DB
MRKPNIRRAHPRHPAVIDLLDSAPTTLSRGAGTPVPREAAPSAPPATLTAPAASGAALPRGGGGGRWRPGRTAAVASAVAAVVLVGVVTVAQVAGDDTGADPVSPADVSEVALGPTDENGLPVLNLPEPTTAETAAAEPGASAGECRAERGDQRSGQGVIAAFNYAYYNRRDAVAARELATPTSSVKAAPELQTFIDKLPQGTNYCLRTVELSDGVFLVDLSVMRPDVPVERGTQTVTTAKIDGRWYVDVFK